MTDQDTLELRRMAANEPIPDVIPDLPALIRSGRRIRTRRRVRGGLGGAVAVGATVAVTVPLLALTSGSAGTSASEPSSAAVTSTPAAPPSTRADSACGVLSCVHAASSVLETGTVVDELTVGTLPGGATEIIYVARNRGVGAWKGQTVDVLSSGYRLDGRLRRTAWALQPGTDDPAAPRFWASPELANGRPGANDHYAVLGYVDGSPDAITWSRPDGSTGEVDGMLRLDGYTAFYVAQPMPSDYVPPPPARRNEDGSVTFLTDEGPRTVRSGDKLTGGLQELMGDATEFSPDLTIHTSDGWSCTLRDCGTGG